MGLDSAEAHVQTRLMFPEVEIDRIYHWIVAGGADVDIREIDTDGTLQSTSMFHDQFNSGWRSIESSDQTALDFTFESENIYYDQDVVARGGVIRLRNGQHLFCFCPRPISPEEPVITFLFDRMDFLKLAMQDCGRAMILHPSKRPAASRAGIVKAKNQELEFFGRGREEAGGWLSWLRRRGGWTR